MTTTTTVAITPKTGLVAEFFHTFEHVGHFIPWTTFKTMGEIVAALGATSLALAATYIVRRLRRPPNA